MYNKKYYLADYEEFNRHNGLYDDLEGCTCYLAYLKPGERGWFLYEKPSEFWPHRVHTSIIKDVKYAENGNVVVTTENTRLTFAVMGE